MKKIFSLLLAVLLVVSCLSGCQSKPKEEKPGIAKYHEVLAALGKCEIKVENPTGVLKKILDSGKMVIGTSPDYPAAEFVTEDGEVMGCEILLAKFIANSLGVELVIEAMDFSGILAGVDTGKVDLGVSGFGYKADRAENYEISKGYQATSTAAHHTLLVKASDLDKYNSLADFTGIKVDAQANSLQEMYCQDQLTNIELQKVASLDQAILDLVSGKVDAVALDSTTAKNYAEQSEGQLVSVYVEKKIEFDLSLYNDYSGNILVAKKGETSFMDVINQVIDYVIENKLYTDWYYVACDAAEISPEEGE